MQQDGARLTKLKEVFKRAIQEILKEETAVNDLLSSPKFKDSFYSESTVHMNTEDVKKLFVDIKSRLTEVFKAKIRQTNLDFKLNSLDKDIKDNRNNTKDLRSTEYIKEIFESHIIDKKEELVKRLEQEISESETEANSLKAEIAELEERIKMIDIENETYEKEYQTLVKEIEMVFEE